MNNHPTKITSPVTQIDTRSQFKVLSFADGSSKLVSPKCHVPKKSRFLPVGPGGELLGSKSNFNYCKPCKDEACPLGRVTRDFWEQLNHPSTRGAVIGPGLKSRVSFYTSPPENEVLHANISSEIKEQLLKK